MRETGHPVCASVGHWVHGVEQQGPDRVRWRCRICGAENVSDAISYETSRSRQRTVVTLFILISVFSGIYLLEMNLMARFR